MRTIEKGDEPKSLRLHRKRGGTYADYKDTDELRRALLRDQGHLCCYCMKRITRYSMKNEHWVTQSGHVESTLDWDKIMGACKGGDGERGSEVVRHCDTSRGDTPIKVNPLDRAQRCERHIRYLPTGDMRSGDPEIQHDINVTLNLNNQRIKRERQRIYDVLMTQLKAKGGDKDHWPPEMIREVLEAWKRRNGEGQLPEYCQVAIYFLEWKLPKSSR